MSDKQKRVCWLTLTVVAFLLSTLVLVVAQTRRRAQAPRQGHAPEVRIEVVRITVRSTGFEPTEIKYPSKPFLLAVDNQSGLDNLTLTLYRADTEDKARAKIHDLAVSLKSLRKQEITELGPGRYVLKEAKHPNWTCRITITPQ